jgi:hypothetical protein
LVERGRAVLFTPTFRLVQELLVAKRDLALARTLQKLDAFEIGRMFQCNPATNQQGIAGHKRLLAAAAW